MEDNERQRIMDAIFYCWSRGLTIGAQTAITIIASEVLETPYDKAREYLKQNVRSLYMPHMSI